jgi:hypothetical protein
MQHRKQGEQQTVSTQRPHHVSSLAFRISGLFRISSLGFRISPDPSGRIMRNKPIKTTHAKGVPPLYLTPTEVGETPTTPKMQNEPNFSRTGPVENQKMRNKPNSRIPGVPPPHIFAKRTQFHPAADLWKTKNAKRTQSQPGNYAKRTQFTPTPTWPAIQLCETNPISAATVLWKSKKSKRTQSTVPPPHYLLSTICCF